MCPLTGIFRWIYLIYLNDLFHLAEIISLFPFTDDTCFHACDSDLRSLLQLSEYDGSLPIEWFECNQIIINKDKCKMFVSRHKFETTWIKMLTIEIFERTNSRNSA